MAADQRLEHGMSSVGHDGAVLWMRLESGFLVVHIAVIPLTKTIVFSRHPVKILATDHAAKIPQLDTLVFAVGYAVATIAFGSHIGNTFCVTGKDASRLAP